MSGYRALSLRTRQVLGGIWLIGVAASGYTIAWPLLHGHLLSLSLATLVLIAFTTVADLFPVTFDPGYEITVSNVFLIAAIVIYRKDPGTATHIALVSTLAWSGVGLIAFVPLVGLAVFPLQIAALVLRGLVFEYLGLTSLGAYATLYSGHAARRAVSFGRSRMPSSPVEHPA